jgi:hypothetical protein
MSTRVFCRGGLQESALAFEFEELKQSSGVVNSGAGSRIRVSSSQRVEGGGARFQDQVFGGAPEF